MDAEQVIQAGRLYLYYEMRANPRPGQGLRSWPRGDRHVAALAEIVEVRFEPTIDLASGLDADIALGASSQIRHVSRKTTPLRFCLRFRSSPVGRNELGPQGTGSSFLEHNDLQAARAVHVDGANVSFGRGCHADGFRDRSFRSGRAARSDGAGCQIVATGRKHGFDRLCLRWMPFDAEDLPLVPVSIDLAETLS